MIQRRDFLAIAIALAGTPVMAQGGRVVRIVVPFAAGAVQDTIARAISNELAAALGVTVIVENRAGAGGTIGTAYVAKAPADGNTLILAAASHTINGSLYTKLPYDPLKDFSAIAHLGNAGYAMMVHPDVPAKTAADFIRHAKANPGKLNYATAGVGSATHLSMAYFCGLAGIDMVHVPLKSTGEAVNEVLSGRAQAVIAAFTGALPFARDARVRLIGVTTPKRSKHLPELPTIAESGMPGYEFDSWIGLLAPAGVPRAEVERINAAVGGLLKTPAILERLDKLGAEPQAMTPDEFTRLLHADFERMARVVKTSGARAD